MTGYMYAKVMENSAEKIRLAGNPNVMVCERGTMFGYSKLSSPFQIFFVSTEFSILDILKSLGTNKNWIAEVYIRGC